LIFIDTNVAIDIRDAVPGIRARIADLPDVPVASVITRIELEGGVQRDAANAVHRRRALDLFLARTEIVLLTDGDITAYGAIVAAQGFDRRRILDRLIAAQVRNRGARLITRNPRDFRDIDGLTLIEWP
jgi:tRNA(fMet)-specific endonuclease VapC